MAGDRRMDWKTLLAYITGTVDQELLLRNELSLSRFVARSPREQELATQALHKRRLRIDPVHSRVKRCRSVKDWSRLWKQGVSDLTTALGCALHTFRVCLPPMAANTLSGINSVVYGTATHSQKMDAADIRVESRPQSVCDAVWRAGAGVKKVTHLT